MGWENPIWAEIYPILPPVLKSRSGLVNGFCSATLAAKGYRIFAVGKFETEYGLLSI